ncbi:MAG: cytochrome C biogenesis protein, partial [Bacteroidetes bacterium]|nr:cytochrome C biogenesis protein [Bacteroidota bacterium]
MYAALKKVSILIGFLTSVLFSFSQDSTVLYSWQVTSKKIGEGKYELTFSTPGLKGWQLYTPDQVLGQVKVADLIFPDSAITMDEGFSFSEKPLQIKSSIFDDSIVKVSEGPAQWKAFISIKGAVPEKLQGKLSYTYGKDDEFYPSTEFSFVTPLEGGISAASNIKVASIDIHHPVNNCGDDDTKGKSLFTIFLLGILGGLIALLTPCVFPMIPVTVTFFTKKSQDRKKGVANAVLYGLFIFLIYILITLPFHIADKAISPEIFN